MWINEENNEENNVAVEDWCIVVNQEADVPEGWGLEHMTLCGDHVRILHPDGHVYIIDDTSLWGDDDEYNINDHG